MRALSVLFLFFFSGLCVASAQNSQLTAQSNNTSDGTWQVQVINSRSQPFIPGNIHSLVAENRHATETVYVQLGTEVRLKIVSLSETTKPEFIALEKIVHITE